MTHQIDSLLNDLESTDLARQRRGWFAAKTLVDWDIAPELSGKVAECYHKGIGVAADPYETLRYCSLYYPLDPRLKQLPIPDEQPEAELEAEPPLPPRLTLSNAEFDQMMISGLKSVRGSKLLNATEIFNDSFSSACGIPDLIFAVNELPVLVELCSRLGIVSFSGYALQFVVTLSSLIHDLYRQRHLFKRDGFFNVLGRNLLKDDRWSRFCDSILWVVVPVIGFFVIPEVDMILFITACAVNCVTQIINGLQYWVDTVKHIRILNAELAQARAEKPMLEGDPERFAACEAKIQKLTQAVDDLHRQKLRYFLQSMFSAFMTIVYTAGGVAMFYNPVAGCAIMLCAMALDFAHSRWLAYQDYKARSFQIPAEYRNRVTFFGGIKSKNNEYVPLEPLPEPEFRPAIV